MDLVLLTNHEMLELPELLLEHLLQQAAITVAVDIDLNLRLAQAYLKDINQDLPALLLTNPVLADTAHGLLVELLEVQAALADIALIPQEDLLVVAVVDSDLGVLPCPWIPAQV
jgi:hypothetical protein